jgi:hypothetical protein
MTVTTAWRILGKRVAGKDGPQIWRINEKTGIR